MADALRLKHELKSWERNFRDLNGGRAPTKEDTKKDSAIGECSLPVGLWMIEQVIFLCYSLFYPILKPPNTSCTDLCRKLQRPQILRKEVQTRFKCCVERVILPPVCLLRTLLLYPQCLNHDPSSRQRSCLLQTPSLQQNKDQIRED